MKPSTHIYYTLYNPTKNRKANINVTMIKHVSTIKDDPIHEIILLLRHITHNYSYLVYLMSQRSQNECVNNSKYYAYMVIISTLYYIYVDCF